MRTPIAPPGRSEQDSTVPIRSGASLTCILAAPPETAVTCDTLDALSAELALGVASADQRAAALTHIECCPRCAEELAAMSRVAALLEVVPPSETPAGFAERVLSGTHAVTDIGDATTPDRRRAGARSPAVGRRTGGARP